MKIFIKRKNNLHFKQLNYNSRNEKKDKIDTFIKCLEF